MSQWLTKIFGSKNERVLKKCKTIVKEINQLENSIKNLNNEQLKNKTEEFRNRIKNGETLNKILPEAFAVLREASVREWEIRPFDVQLMGAILLHQGKISEMRTGEGKTLTATLAAYLNAIEGKGVHIITVNDYLAKRDADKMSALFARLGMTVGCNIAGLTFIEKKAAYDSDVTYGTNNEFGFDYLRDNMAYDANEKAQRGLHYAIVDEIDSILIDEARTPLIISGNEENMSDIYQKIDIIPRSLKEGVRTGHDKNFLESEDYIIDLKQRSVYLTEKGYEKSENMLIELGVISEEESLYDTHNTNLLLHLQAAIKAHTLFNINEHYVVEEGEIKIVDEFTGRIMKGRRWSEGLHQAIEAKEGVEIKPENITMATITLQNYFRMYKKLSGMTGTADTEAFEFSDIYNLETIVVPTNRPVKRHDYPDVVFLKTESKIRAILEDIKTFNALKRPLLIGTSSIENNEMFSALLTEAGLKHEVLNAKNHERESEIIAQAGKAGSITIATNMAGRGTDIILGGNIEPDIEKIKADDSLSEETKNLIIKEMKNKWKEEHEYVKSIGGLHIIGTERHESRRIDNQLRGRSGRQGDPGSSRFYLSFEDPLLKIFTNGKILQFLRNNFDANIPLEGPMISRNVEKAQKGIEAHHYNIRKQLIDYDDVSNKQRNAIYKQREEIMYDDDESIKNFSSDIIKDVIDGVINYHIKDPVTLDMWDIPELHKVLSKEFDIDLPIQEWIDKESIDKEELAKRVKDAALYVYELKESSIDKEQLRKVEKQIILESIDRAWREQINALEYLRKGIHLRGFAQKDPKLEYKREAFILFRSLMDTVKNDVARFLMNIRPVIPGTEDELLAEDSKKNYESRIN